jgi:cellobiose-specific phosphotransferase system component IIA
MNGDTKDEFEQCAEQAIQTCVEGATNEFVDALNSVSAGSVHQAELHIASADAYIKAGDEIGKQLEEHQAEKNK